MTAEVRARPSFVRFFAHSTRRDPYPLLAMLRDHSPFVADHSTAVLARYRDCEAVLRDRATSSDYRTILPDVLNPPEPFAFIFQDPPEHTGNRLAVAAHFTRSASACWAGLIHAVATEMLDRARVVGHIDVVRDFASEIPMQLAFQLLGIPKEDRPQVKEWISELARFIDIFGLTERDIARVANVNEAVDDYFASLLAKRARDPAQDLVSRMALAESVTDPVAVANLVQTFKLLAVAGVETTVNLIGNTIQALLHRPEQLAAIREEPELVEAAVEETLRFDPPFHMVYRHTIADLTVRDVRIPAGTRLMLLLGATGRDPEVHERPDEFDLWRTDKRHLGFASGPHFCLGAPLARLEAAIAVRAFVTRVVEPELATDRPPYRRHVSLRGLAELPVRFRAIRG